MVKKAKYAEIFVSVKMPIREGANKREVETDAEHLASEVAGTLAERYEVIHMDWVYRDEFDRPVYEEELE